MKTYKYTCNHCDKAFQHRKKDKKFCSSECYYQSKNKSVEKKCKYCEKNFTVAFRFRDQKYCNQKCMGKSYGNKQDKILKNCQHCNKEYRAIKSRVDSKFCSSECFNFDRRDGENKTVCIKCNYCNKDFECLWRNRSNRMFCSISCANSGENNYFYGKPCSRIGPPWTKGKTAKTNLKIEALGKKISATQKRQFDLGLRSNRGKNNPNYGKTREDRTPEQLENYSKAAAKRILDGKTGYGKNHKTGKYCSSISGKVMRYKSSYEERAMKIFDKCENVGIVTDYDYEPIVIKYDTGRRYIPDFLVRTKDGSQYLIEVKPQFLFDIDEIVKLKCSAAENYCLENNMVFLKWTGQTLSIMESNF